MVTLLALGPVELSVMLGAGLLIAGMSLWQARSASKTGLYDAALLEGYARMLLRRASFISVLYTLLGVVVGIVCFGMSQSVGRAASWIADVPPELVSALAFFVPLGLCYSLGQSRAYALRFQAQNLLCQLQIEKNTRVSAKLANSLAELHLDNVLARQGVAEHVQRAG